VVLSWIPHAHDTKPLRDKRRSTGSEADTGHDKPNGNGKYTGVERGWNLILSTKNLSV